MLKNNKKVVNVFLLFRIREQILLFSSKYFAFFSSFYKIQGNNLCASLVAQARFTRLNLKINQNMLDFLNVSFLPIQIIPQFNKAVIS